MWENETVVLLTSLKKRIIGDKKTVRFQTLREDSAIPDFIKKIFSEKVEYFRLKETPLTVKGTPHFDLVKADLAEIRKHTEDIVINAAFFTKEEVERFIQEALIYRLDFLHTPVAAMSRHLFQNEMAVSVERIPEILEPFRKILSYPDSLAEACRNENLQTLTRKDYQRLSRSLFPDSEQPEAVTEILKDMSLFSEYLAETKGEEVNRLEGDVVQEFLSDRYMTGFRKAVDIEIKLGRKEFSTSDLELILRRYIELRTEFDGYGRQTAAETQVVTAEEPSTEEKEDAPVLSADQEEDTLNLGDVWEDAAGEENPELVDELMSEKEDRIGTPAEEQEPEAAAKDAESDVWPKQEETGAESEPAEDEKKMRIIRREKAGDKDGSGKRKEEEVKLESLQALLDEKTEKLFIKKLFSGDMEAFTALFEKLDEAESWRVAKILIDNELFKRDVDPFSREAIKLVDMVYSRYYPEESAGG